MEESLKYVIFKKEVTCRMVELTETILCLAEMQNVTESLFALEFYSVYFINLVVILWMVTKEKSNKRFPQKLCKCLHSEGGKI